jgi:eukaryotic-like serine/threonine-protein kinase
MRGLSSLLVLASATKRSRRAYQDFLALWKDADPDTPVLIQARAEYAKLVGP